MFKTWSPYGFSWHDQPVQVVPMTRRGVDKDWAKQASADVFLKEFQDIEVQPNHALIYVSPVADYERYSNNINGDGFPKKANQSKHWTFKEHAHLFREHNNTDPSKAFGRPVATGYNERLGRIDVLNDVDGNTKHGSAIIQAAEEGKPIDWSMSCRVPWDRCTICGNLATSPYGPSDQPLDIPSPGYCKHAKSYLNAILDDGRKVAVLNDDPDFFDNSHVDNPAEVLATTLAFRKAASAGTVPLDKSGVGMAMKGGLWAPLYARASFPDWFKTKLAFAQKLAEMEKQIQVEPHIYSDIASGMPDYEMVDNGTGDIAEARDTLANGHMGTVSPSARLAALRQEGIVAGLPMFAAINGVSSKAANEAMRYTPSLFEYLRSQNLLTDIANNGTYDRYEMMVPVKCAAAASTLAPMLSLASIHLHDRSMARLGTPVPVILKEASESSSVISEEASTLLQKYAAYCLSELAAHDNGDATTSRCARNGKVASRLGVVLTALGRNLYYR